MSHGKNGNYALHHAKPFCHFCHFCGTIIIFILISFLNKNVPSYYLTNSVVAEIVFANVL